MIGHAPLQHCQPRLFTVDHAPFLGPTPNTHPIRSQWLQSVGVAKKKAKGAGPVCRGRHQIDTVRKGAWPALINIRGGISGEEVWPREEL